MRCMKSIAAVRPATPAQASAAPITIALLQAADLSSFLHESGHFFLEVLVDMAAP